MNKVNIEDFKNEKFKYQTFVRVGDLNYGNHLAHDKLITILHDARVCFFKEYQLQEINIENQYSLLVTSLTVNYISQAYLGDIISVIIFCDDIKNASFELKYKVSNQDSVVALCSTTLVCYNQEKRRPDKIPKSLLSIL